MCFVDSNIGIVLMKQADRERGIYTSPVSRLSASSQEASCLTNPQTLNTREGRTCQAIQLEAACREETGMFVSCLSLC
ncbi:unnamed protein product [Pleuronectes platessa]|uniref:Uncharacterized protein n=1 Tax=Pleuronectes platessa TaxID=8262 RepID=A0A9N7YBV3_PLEPL|nr:unnamed protein product [Pleuronectes platessa]